LSIPQKVRPFLELRVFIHLWSRSDAPYCSRYGYSICHRRKFGQVWGPQLPYEKSQKNTAVGRHSFGPTTIPHGIIVIILRC